MRELRAVRPRWDLGIIAVCRACDGYEKPLRRGIKDAVAAAGLRRRVRVIASSCLDICPKGGTAVLVATTRAVNVTVVRAGVTDARPLAPLLRSLRDADDEPILGSREPSPDGPR